MGKRVSVPGNAEQTTAAAVPNQILEPTMLLEHAVEVRLEAHAGRLSAVKLGFAPEAYIAALPVLSCWHAAKFLMLQLRPKRERRVVSSSQSASNTSLSKSPQSKSLGLVALQELLFQGASKTIPNFKPIFAEPTVFDATMP